MSLEADRQGEAPPPEDGAMDVDTPTQSGPPDSGLPQQTSSDVTEPTEALTEGGAMQDETEQPPPPPPAKPVCGICNQNDGKYKCTRCKLPFCSVACNKIHKENHPPDPDPPAAADISTETTQAQSAATASATHAPESQNPDPRNPFSGLDTSDHLRYLFKRFPNLPSQLRAIGAATDPPAEAQPTTIKEAILAKAAAASRPKKDQWNHDVGIRKGKAALRRARGAPGDDGRGIREYTELIVYLTSEDARNKEAEALLRNQAAQRDADLIRQMVEQDRR